MKLIEEQNYYEILEIAPTATPQEIQKAYEHAKETFHSDSLAIYSLFSEEEIKRIQLAIEEAYHVLIDEERRKAYDQSNFKMTDNSILRNRFEEEEKSKENRGPLAFKEISMNIGEVNYCGKTIREIRERMGIDLKEVSKETKINLKILEYIEGEMLDKLPAPVYLKSFLKSYAQVLHLDSQKVVEDYFQLFKDLKKK